MNRSSKYISNKMGLPVIAGLSGMQNSIVFDSLIDVGALRPTTSKALLSSTNKNDNNGHFIIQKKWKITQEITYDNTNIYKNGYRVAQFSDINASVNKSNEPVTKYTKLT